MKMRLAKKILTAVIICLALILPGCDSDSSDVFTTDNALFIGLGSGFKEDSVIVVVNGKTVLNEEVSTDQTIDMAIDFSAVAPHGRNQLTVMAINKNLFTTTTVLVRGNTYVLVDMIKNSNGTPTGFQIAISDTSPWRGRY